jgi:hypothetical protein
MRNLSLALLIAAPIAANAQTAHDLARLSWGNGAAPTSINVAPAAPSMAGSGATATDLARLTWPAGAPTGRSAAPNADVLLATGGTAHDLARLTGATPDAAPVLEAAGAQLARQISRPHG